MKTVGSECTLCKASLLYEIADDEAEFGLLVAAITGHVIGAELEHRCPDGRTGKFKRTGLRCE